jgi:hypothetical protein
VTLYFPTSDTNVPYGGVRVLYAAVDALNQSGIEAAIVHGGPRFRVSWFPNSTRVVAASKVVADPSRDLVVITEFRASELIPVVAPGVRKIIFNQAPYLTYPTGRFVPVRGDTNPFRDPTILGCITVSVDGERLLSRLWPWMPLRRVRLPILNSHNCSTSRSAGQHSQRSVTLVRRKRPAEASLLEGLMSEFLSHNGWSLCYIEGMTSLEVSDLFSRSPIFVHLPALPGEGLPLLLLEAMSAGCVVVGYTGRGGSEAMTSRTATVIAEGETLKLVEAVKAACDSFGTPRWDDYQARATAGQELVLREYSFDNFRTDLVSAVLTLLEGTSLPRESAGVSINVGPLRPPSLKSRVFDQSKRAVTGLLHACSPIQRDSRG